MLTKKYVNRGFFQSKQKCIKTSVQNTPPYVSENDRPNKSTPRNRVVMEKYTMITDAGKYIK